MHRPLEPKIAIIGLGYVGLPLSLQFARSGVHVLGLDIDPEKVDALNQGRSYIKHVLAETVAEQVKACRLEAATDFARVNEVEAVIICVPTPLNKNREPEFPLSCRQDVRSLHTSDRDTGSPGVDHLSGNHRRGPAAVLEAGAD